MFVRNLVVLIALVFSPYAMADKATAINSGCFGCHQIDNKTVGPAIKDIAKKHKNTDLEQLVQTVKNGKSGDQLSWGKTPMPPNAAPEENIRKVIKWMLSH